MIKMLHETYLANIRNIEGIKVLITRFYPRGLRKYMFDFWMRDLAPSVNLLNSYKNDEVTEEQYVHQYSNEIFSNPKAIDSMLKLYDMSREKDVWLICYEKEGYCHRKTLLNCIQNIQKYVPVDKECLFKVQGYSLNGCTEKVKHSIYTMVPTSTGKSKMCVIRPSIGQPKCCDFYPSLKGNELKQCEIFLKKTKIFTCYTCLLIDGIFCLEKQTIINSFMQGLSCETYVEEKLRFGNKYILTKINVLFGRGFTLKQIVSVWKKNVNRMD